MIHLLTIDAIPPAPHGLGRWGGGGGGGENDSPQHYGGEWQIMGGIAKNSPAALKYPPPPIAIGI